jgi:hypothetical protein
MFAMGSVEELGPRKHFSKPLQKSPRCGQIGPSIAAFQIAGKTNRPS